VDFSKPNPYEEIKQMIPFQYCAYPRRALKDDSLSSSHVHALGIMLLWSRELTANVVVSSLSKRLACNTAAASACVRHLKQKGYLKIIDTKSGQEGDILTLEFLFADDRSERQKANAAARGLDKGAAA
jgi:hypothetical protein